MRAAVADKSAWPSIEAELKPAKGDLSRARPPGKPSSLWGPNRSGLPQTLQVCKSVYVCQQEYSLIMLESYCALTPGLEACWRQVWRISAG